MWALHITGGVDPKTIRDLLNPQQEEEVRGWAVRLAMETPASWQACKPCLLAAAAYGVAARAPGTRLGAATLAFGRALELAGELVTHSADADDPYLPLMLWYGIEPLFGPGATSGELLPHMRIPLLASTPRAALPLAIIGNRRGFVIRYARGNR